MHFELYGADSVMMMMTIGNSKKGTFCGKYIRERKKLSTWGVTGYLSFWYMYIMPESVKKKSK